MQSKDNSKLIFSISKSFGEGWRCEVAARLGEKETTNT
jgi:hypothetical protein